MTVASSEPTRAVALGVPGHQPLCRLNRTRIRYDVVDIGAQEQSGTADVRRFVETEPHAIDPGGGLKRVHRATVSPHASPVLRGAAYIAALKGDPWRPQM